MAEEYILTNDDGDKVYLVLFEKYAEARSASSYEENENTSVKWSRITSPNQLKMLDKLTKLEPVASDKKNKRIVHHLNQKLIKPLLIENQPYPDYFIDNIRKEIYVFKNIKKNDRLSEPVKDEPAQTDTPNVIKFQYYANSSSFEGRTAELKYLSEMCENTETPFCWTSICGKGGAGKSRLAFELCIRLSNKGWIVYYPSAAEITAEQIKSNLVKTDADILICFDDVNSDIGIIRNFLNYCIETTFRQNWKIRLILIDRDFDYFQRRLSGTLLSYKYQCNGAADPEVKTVEGSLVLEKPSKEVSFSIPLNGFLFGIVITRKKKVIRVRQFFKIIFLFSIFSHIYSLSANNGFTNNGFYIFHIIT